MKLSTILLSLCLLTCNAISTYAQPAATGKVQIINNPDGSISFNGITKRTFKDVNGNLTTDAALDDFLKINDNYAKKISIDINTGEELICVEKLHSRENEVIGKKLPSLIYSDINGKETKIVDGVTPFLICFWSTTCANCIIEIEILDQLAREFPDLKIVAMTPEDLSKIKKFMEIKKHVWEGITLITDYKEEYLPILQSKLHPTTVLVSKSGVVEKIYFGNKMRQMIVDMDSISDR